MPVRLMHWADAEQCGCLLDENKGQIQLFNNIINLAVILSQMNFLNFLTSASNLLNFNLEASTPTPLKQNKILVPPQISESSPSLKSFQKVEAVGNSEALIAQSSNMQNEELKKILKGQQQLLINQYLELNIKYLSHQLKSAQNEEIIKSCQDNQVEPLEAVQEKNEQEKKHQNRKKIKKINKCGHQNKSHYAKGMCNNCYHKYGRTKRPWNCPHSKLYAAGMCQNCYINNYNRKKREQKGNQHEQNNIVEEEPPCENGETGNNKGESQ